MLGSEILLSFLWLRVSGLLSVRDANKQEAPIGEGCSYNPFTHLKHRSFNDLIESSTLFNITGRLVQHKINTIEYITPDLVRHIYIILISQNHG